MNKKLKALLSCLALTATIGAVSACDQLQGLIPGFGSSDSQVETESTPIEESSSVTETPDLGKNESMVTFVADGETVRVIVYKNGAESIIEPAVPEKAGYTGAWEAYELNGNITVNAVYTAIEYTATYMADGEVVATVAYTVENAPEAPEVPAKDFYTGAWEEVEMVGDITVNAVYTAIEYTVTFMADGEVVATVPYTVESTEITVPEVPAKEGYGATWENFALAGGDLTVNAVYKLGIYNVTFVADGVTVATEEYSAEDKEITVPEVPAKDYYTGVWEAYELTTGDVVVNAIYTANTYNVTFMADGVTVATVPYTVENTEIEAPAVPEKAHYENGAWEAYTLAGGDVTVNATYTAIEYTITFMVGEEVIGTATYTMDNATFGEVAIPEKAGYSASLEDVALDGGDKVVNINYTANTYTITYNANGGEASEYTQEVTYDAAYTLATATAPKGYQEFLGWADEKGNMVTSETWNIAKDVTLTAVYSEGITFSSMSEVPSSMTKTDNTEYLAITELDGNKVLEIKSNGKAPGMKVTTDFLAQFFADSSVDYIAFEAKTGTTTINNFRRDTNRDGKLTAVTYEQDMTFTHPVDSKTYATTGIRADAWKTFYFSRADYNFWVSQGLTESRFIASGDFNVGDSIYLDNIRPATAAEYAVSSNDFESTGVRINDANGKTLLIYTLGQGTTWQFNMQVSNGGFTNVGFTNENVSSGNTAMVFTKEAGNFNINIPSGKHFYNEIVAKTGYWAVDVYVPVGSDAQVAYHTTTYPGAALVKGAWNTIYVGGSKNQLTISDTTGGTYMVDNIRSITADEYTMGGLSMEVNAGGLRTSNLGDETAHSGVAYYYGGNDHTKNVFSFAIAEGNADGDVNALSNVRLTSEQSHSGNQSLAFDKGNGYMYITMRNDSSAYELLKNGFTFWIYSTVGLNGTTASNFINGCNGKFNGGEGMNIPANTWTQVTVTAEDMNPTRFLIIQGSAEGTIYLDDFQPLN